MKASTRAVLTTGIAALSLGALAVTASVPPESMRSIQVPRPMNFAADIVPIESGVPVEPPSDDELNSALALIEQLAPVSDGRVVTVNLSSHEHPGTVTVAPAPNAAAKSDAALVDVGPDDIAGQDALAEPAPLNAASDIIDGVYSISRYWANYVSLELGPWLINWIPFGYLISDQIYIWYPDFVLPTVDSFVYDFLDPVVNNPLNLGVWIDGIGDILNTAATGVVNGIGSEINYLVTFGWFPIPLPPLPNFPLPGLGSASAATPSAAALASGETGADETEADTSVAKATDEVATDPADTAATDEPTNTVTEDETPTTTTGQDAPAPVEEQPEAAVDQPAVEVTDEPADEAADAEGTDDSAVEDVIAAGDAADSAAESGVAEQPGDDTDIGKAAQQDNTPGADEDSGDNDSDSDGVSTKASASDN